MDRQGVVFPIVSSRGYYNISLYHIMVEIYHIKHASYPQSTVHTVSGEANIEPKYKVCLLTAVKGITREETQL